MDAQDFSAHTPRVLKECLALFEQKHSSSSHSASHKSAPTTPARKYLSHPDIQFFSSIKKKHHFEYHKQKHQMNFEPVHRHSPTPVPGGFDPYSRELLIERIRTYDALNWSIPPSVDNSNTVESLPSMLTELYCAANGWTCEKVSQTSNFTNHLKCSTCGGRVILRFNSIDEESYGKFSFDLSDIARLNDNLKVSYLSEIRQGAHSASCPWKTILCSLRGTYYLTPYVGATNSTLITEYLGALGNLIENLPLLGDMSGFCQKLLPKSLPEDDIHFIQISKMWFLNRFYTDTKENFAYVLDFVCPAWIYKLAAMGWTLTLQQIDQDQFLILSCICCNQRLFLAHEQDAEQGEHNCHKSWCSHSKLMGSNSFFEYFVKMLILLEKSIGPHGEYLIDQELAFDLDAGTPSRKRRESFDVNEGLEKLTKLRKMYFVT